MRPGTYIFNDRNTIFSGACTADDCAATIIATVVSTSVPGQFVIDGGSKTFSSDKAAAEGFARGLLFGKAWEGKPASEKQIALMQRMRIRFAEGISAGAASVLINERFNGKRKAKGATV